MQVNVRVQLGPEVQVIGCPRKRYAAAGCERVHVWPIADGPTRLIVRAGNRQSFERDHPASTHPAERCSSAPHWENSSSCWVRYAVPRVTRVPAGTRPVSRSARGEQDAAGCGRCSAVRTTKLVTGYAAQPVAWAANFYRRCGRSGRFQQPPVWTGTRQADAATMVVAWRTATSTRWSSSARA